MVSGNYVNGISLTHNTTLEIAHIWTLAGHFIYIDNCERFTDVEEKIQLQMLESIPRSKLDKIFSNQILLVVNLLKNVHLFTPPPPPPPFMFYVISLLVNLHLQCSIADI